MQVRRLSCSPCIQNPGSRFARSQIIFLLPRRCCRIGNFFFFLLSPQSLPILKQFSTFLPYSLPLVPLRYSIRALRTICFCFLLAPAPAHALPRPVVTRTTLLSRLHQALPKPAGKRKSICASQLYIPRFSR